MGRLLSRELTRWWCVDLGGKVSHGGARAPPYPRAGNLTFPDPSQPRPCIDHRSTHARMCTLSTPDVHGGQPKLRAKIDPLLDEPPRAGGDNHIHPITTRSDTKRFCIVFGGNRGYGCLLNPVADHKRVSGAMIKCCSIWVAPCSVQRLDFVGSSCRLPIRADGRRPSRPRPRGTCPPGRRGHLGRPPQRNAHQDVCTIDR